MELFENMMLKLREIVTIKMVHEFSTKDKNQLLLECDN